MPNRIHGLAGNGAIGVSVKRSKIIHIPWNGGRARCQRFSFRKKRRLQQLRAADICFRTCHRLRRLLFFRRLHVALGNFAFGASLSSLLVICPLMIYYMLGPASYNNNLGRICPFLPLGLMSLFPFSTVENSQLISSPAIFSILLILVISFFIIFSAWKHRFVLLK